MRCNAMTDSALLMEDRPSAVGFTCQFMQGDILRADFRFAERLATLYHADGSTHAFIWNECI